MGVRSGGQPPGQPACGGVGIPAEFDQRTDRQLCGQGDRARLEGPGPLGEQRVDIGDPAVGILAAIAFRTDHRRRHQRRAALNIGASAQRVDRPQHLSDVLAQRVRLPRGGCGCPLVHHTARIAGGRRGVDNVLDLQQEVRRAARGGSAGTPVVARQQQGVLGPGQRDVEQSALLVVAAQRQLIAVRVDDDLQCLAVVDRGGVEHRDAVQSGVPAQ